MYFSYPHVAIFAPLNQIVLVISWIWCAISSSSNTHGNRIITIIIFFIIIFKSLSIYHIWPKVILGMSMCYTSQKSNWIEKDRGKKSLPPSHILCPNTTCLTEGQRAASSSFGVRQEADQLLCLPNGSHLDLRSAFYWGRPCFCGPPHYWRG